MRRRLYGVWFRLANVLLMIEDGALSMFARLVDRSVERIGRIAADPAHFDRGEIIRLADIWDNNTMAFFGAAAGPTWFLRERRARAGLRWMAGLSEQRRSWMIAEAGPAMARLLGPPVEESLFSRDHRGVVSAISVPVEAVDLSGDYDLARAEIRTFHVERAGSSLDGYLELSVPRRYPVPDSADDPAVRLDLTDLRTVEFDSAGTRGVSLTSGPGGIDVVCGERGRLLAGSARAGLSGDRWWHLSGSGRAADLITPAERATRSRQPGQRRPAPVSALLFHQAMLEIRSIRYAKRVGRVPIPELCGVLAGAGQRVLAAARGRRREEAFERIALDWIEGSPALAHSRMAGLLPPESRLRLAAESVPVPPPSPPPPFPDPAAVLRAITPAGASPTILTMARWAADGVAVNYATRPGDTWSLHHSASEEPTDLTVTTDAFAT